MGFLKEFITFTLLKRLLSILILLFGLTFTTFAQTKPGISADVPAKIIKFFPNPATSSITFEMQQGYDKSHTIQLFNFMGKKVYEMVPSSQRVSLSLDGFYRGVYIFQLRNKFGKVIDTGRFQVIR